MAKSAVKKMEQSTQKPQEITAMLHDWSNGKQEALDALLPLVYNELHARQRGFCAANVSDILCKPLR